MSAKNREEFNEAVAALRQKHADVQREKQAILDHEQRLAEAREKAVICLDSALQEFHNDLEKCSEYVRCSVETQTDNAANRGAWRDLDVETLQNVRIRAARKPADFATAIVEFADGRSMTLANYKQWATSYAANGVLSAEQREIANGYKPAGTRSYEEGFEFGQSWARSLTIARLCRIRNWSLKVNRRDRNKCNALILWLCVRGGVKFLAKDYADDEINMFWRTDGFASDRINDASLAYNQGFVDGAVGVAERVHSNILT